jgi:hypothetical protein
MRENKHEWEEMESQRNVFSLVKRWEIKNEITITIHSKISLDPQ